MACECDQVRVNGSETMELNGVFERFSLQTPDGLSVYRNGYNQYLYFWPAYNDWLIGPDYASPAALLRSSSGNDAPCPEAASDWSISTGTVRPMRLVPDQSLFGGGCDCSRDGVSGGIDTGYPGCADHINDGDVYCYVADPLTCGTDSPSQSFPGAGWVLCTRPDHDQGATSRPGRDLWSGRLEVYYQGRWGTVCDDYFSWEDAAVACRELGFGPPSSSDFQYDAIGGVGQIWMDDLHCTGSESSLIDCSFNGWGSHNCGHHEDVGLICSQPPASDPGPSLIDVICEGCPVAPLSSWRIHNLEYKLDDVFEVGGIREIVLAVEQQVANPTSISISSTEHTFISSESQSFSFELIEESISGVGSSTATSDGRRPHLSGEHNNPRDDPEEMRYVMMSAWRVTRTSPSAASPAVHPITVAISGHRCRPPDGD